jgi:CHAT domain-containing protein
LDSLEEVFDYCRAAFLRQELSLEGIEEMFENQLVISPPTAFSDGLVLLNCGVFLRSLKEGDLASAQLARKYLIRADQVLTDYLEDDDSVEEKQGFLLLTAWNYCYVGTDVASTLDLVERTLKKLIVTNDPAASIPSDVLACAAILSPLLPGVAPRRALALVCVMCATTILVGTTNILLQDIEEARDLLLFAEEIVEHPEQDSIFYNYHDIFFKTGMMVFNFMLDRFENRLGDYPEFEMFFTVFSRYIEDDEIEQFDPKNSEIVKDLTPVHLIDSYYIHNTEITEEIYKQIFNWLDEIELEDNFHTFAMGYILCTEFELKNSAIEEIGFDKKMYDLVMKSFPEGHSVRFRYKLIVLQLMASTREDDNFLYCVALAFGEALQTKSGYYTGLIQLLPHLHEYYHRYRPGASIFFGKYFLFLMELLTRLMEESFDMLRGLSEIGQHPLYGKLEDELVLSGRIGEALELRFFQRGTLQSLNGELQRSDFEFLKFVTEQEKEAQTLLDSLIDLEEKATLDECTEKAREILTFITENILSDKVISPSLKTSISNIDQYLPLGDHAIVYISLAEDVLTTELHTNNQHYKFEREVTGIVLKMHTFLLLYQIRDRNAETDKPKIKNLPFDLYKDVFVDAHEWLKNNRPDITRLTITADSFLGMLPFSALHDGDKELVEYYDIDFGIHDHVPYHSSSLNKVYQNAAVFSSAYSSGFSYQTLPEAQEEAEAIQDILKVSNVSSDAFFELDLAEQSIEEILSKGYDILHFSCHLEIDAADLYKSRLMIGKDGGYINIAHLVDMLERVPLPSLIVFSACNSGLVSYENGLVHSINQMFHVLGVPFVIATFWPLDDSLGKELMTYFYRYLNNQHSSTVSALAKAQRRVRVSEKYNDPYFWAVPKITSVHTNE